MRSSGEFSQRAKNSGALAKRPVIRVATDAARGHGGAGKPALPGPHYPAAQSGPETDSDDDQQPGLDRSPEFDCPARRLSAELDVQSRASESAFGREQLPRLGPGDCGAGRPVTRRAAMHTRAGESPLRRLESERGPPRVSEARAPWRPGAEAPLPDRVPEAESSHRPARQRPGWKRDALLVRFRVQGRARGACARASGAHGPGPSPSIPRGGGGAHWL